MTCLNLLSAPKIERVSRFEFPDSADHSPLTNPSNNLSKLDSRFPGCNPWAPPSLLFGEYNSPQSFQVVIHPLQKRKVTSRSIGSICQKSEIFDFLRIILDSPIDGKQSAKTYTEELCRANSPSQSPPTSSEFDFSFFEFSDLSRIHSANPNLPNP